MEARGGGAGDRAAIGVATAILVLGLLYFARSVFVPLAFALFTMALAWPLQAKLQRWMPKLVALLITLSFVVLVIVVVGSIVAWGVGRLGQWLFLNADRLEAVYNSWVIWLEGHGIAVVALIAERFDVDWLVRAVRDLYGHLNSVTSFAILVFILAMLGLLEVDDFKARLQSPLAQPYGHTILQANLEIARKLRRFMVVRTIASVLTGLVVWAFASVAGLELAVAWGAMAFALNYIPFIGPLLATLMPTLFAIAQFDSWQMGLLVFVCLNVIQFIISSYLEPLFTGATLDISPLGVMFAVFFWSFMWQLPGAFISVPILIAFIVYCAAVPETRWIAVLLSGSNAKDMHRQPADKPD
jgi:AI-2 transport protein TqsA